MKGKTIYTIFMLLIMPLTILASFYFLGDRKFYLASMLILVYIMIPLFAKLEKRKPQARELIIIAVMIAIAAVSRAAFFFTPQFKPILAIVIISGLALGRESGFFIGAMSAFVSNFIFGQGPWTPWQMFAMGLVGWIAGCLAEKGILKNRIPILVFGAFAGGILYGAIVDVWTILAFTAVPSWKTAVGVYSLALIPNLIHGTATVLFLAILAKPMTEKLNRVKQKYGMTMFINERSEA